MNKQNIRDKQYHETHVLIYETLHDLLKDIPFEKITIRDICNACNISIGSFYHHFKNKDEIIEYGYNLFDESIKEIILKKEAFQDIEDKLLFLFELELSMIEQQGPTSTTALFAKQLTFQHPNILDEKRFFYFELVETSKQYVKEKNIETDPERMIIELLRVSRGSIYAWCLHKGDYGLVEESLPVIKRLLKTY